MKAPKCIFLNEAKTKFICVNKIVSVREPNEEEKNQINQQGLAVPKTIIETDNKEYMCYTYSLLMMFDLLNSYV